MKKYVLILLFLLEHSVMQAQERYTVPCRADLLFEYAQMVKSQMGIKEKTGKNDGEVQKYAKEFGYKKDVSYCNLGLLWCWKKSCEKLGISTEYIPVPIDGTARSSFNYAKKKGKKTDFKPEKHDNFILKYGTWQGHIAKVDSVLPKGWIRTYEFNTSPSNIGSQSNGGGNYPRLRNYLIPTGRMMVAGFVGFETNIDNVNAATIREIDNKYLTNIEYTKKLINNNKGIKYVFV